MINKLYIENRRLISSMKIIHATPGMGAAMSQDEIDKFLESKLNVQLATIDEMGDPVIQPLWFYYDKAGKKLYLETSKTSKKVQNMRKKPDIYFSIDDESFPYKCVKGKAAVKISEDVQRNMPIIEKINLKYLGTLDHPLAKMLMENARNGSSVMLELSPRYFSTWDFGKTS